MNTKVEVDISEIEKCKITDAAPIFREPCPDCGVLLGCHMEELYYPEIDRECGYVLICDACEKDWFGYVTVESVSVRLRTSNLVGYED